jgi:hypothetical protein
MSFPENSESWSAFMIEKFACADKPYHKNIGTKAKLFASFAPASASFAVKI